MSDYRTARAGRAEEEAQAAYDEAYDRIEASLIAANLADGGMGRKPSGEHVHRCVLAEFKRNQEN